MKVANYKYFTILLIKKVKDMCTGGFHTNSSKMRVFGGASSFAVASSSSAMYLLSLGSY